jgi:hypothetical protein
MIFGSCMSPKKRAVRKINKLIEKHNLKADTVVRENTDTFYLTDTLTIPEVKWDTVVAWSLDTLMIIQRDGVETQLQIQTDTLWLQNTVLSKDTVFQKQQVVKTVTKEVKVPEKIIKKKKYIPWWVKVLIFTLAAALIVLGMKLIRF